MPIQSLMLTRPLATPDDARTPDSATMRNTLFFGSLSMPSLSVLELQKRRSTRRDWEIMRDCSQNFMKKMYQVPADMMPRSTRTVFSTRSPVAHIEPRPYGLDFGAPEDADGVATGGGVASAGAAAGAAAGGAPGVVAGAAVVGAGGGVCAMAVPLAAPARKRRAAATARCFEFMTCLLRS